MDKNIAKPFLKWAGGKGQLINEIKNVLPICLTQKKFTYVEPFVGSGAMFFWMINNYPGINKAIISDLNFDLINSYNIIKNNPKDLVTILDKLQNEFHNLDGEEIKKKEYYYNKRDIFNLRKVGLVEHAALFIFLNKTCFNGLYRVNKNNFFNVPMGSYKKPTICNKENIFLVSNALKNVDILCCDFEETITFAGKDSFFYFDPPYKPLIDNLNFTSYTKENFDDNDQKRLRNFCLKLNELNCNWILSNSDVNCLKNQNNFFDDLYSNFNITRIDAKRSINSNSERRGKIKELLIYN